MAQFSVVCLCLCVLARGLAAPSPSTINRLRNVPRPKELTLSSAKSLHAEFLTRSRMIEGLHGHQRGVPPSQPRLASPVSNLSASVPTIFPTDFGADPTGAKDSTAAFTAAVAALLQGGAPHKMASGIHDLGGATLDLAGGQYLISAPVIIPMYYGNLAIARGTLRASATFPSNQWLIMVGDKSCNPDGQG